VDSFSCGSFVDDNLSSTNRVNVQEDSVELMVSSTSFSREDWVCSSCDVGHKLLPRKRNKPQWTKGRKLVILSDQNMPAAMPSLDEKCPAIIRVEGALLSELGDIFYALLRDFTLPEGSILLIGSLSHLMEEGLVGYAKSLGAEFRRFSKLFDFTVHVIPFIPPPAGGTNDPDLVTNLIHITTWLEKVQRWNLSQYYGILRQYVISSGTPGDLQMQKTQRHKMPASYELFGDYVMMCHPIGGLGNSLPRICPRNEQVITKALLTNLNTVFKWDLDASPLSMRGLGDPQTAGPCKAAPRTDAVIIGGSNAGLLHDAFHDLGKTVESMKASGWTIGKSAVDALLPILTENLARLPESVPIIIYCLDNSCFKALNKNGDLVSFTRSKKDKLFHVEGDLVVTPFTLLTSTLAELDRVIAACGNRRIFILSVLPRYFLKPCCEDISHCANVCRHDDTAIEAGKKLLSDLEELNIQLAKRFNSKTTQFLFTGDILSGKQHCSMGDLVDCLYNCWRNDSVHGDKSAYMKIAMGLLDFLEPKPNPYDNRDSSRKRARPPSPSPLAEDTPRHTDRAGDSSRERLADGGTARSTSRTMDRFDYTQRRDGFNRSRSAYSGYPGDNRRGGGGGGYRRF
jgi:hypothetical protein